MYYILKFSGTWSLYDASSGTSKVLTSQQVDLVKDLFQKALRDGAILDALSISPISANKLQQVTTAPGIDKASSKGRTAAVTESPIK